LVRRFLSSAAIGLVTLIPSTAHAQQAAVEPNTVTVTPFLSVSFGLSDDPGADLGIDLGSSLGIGAGVEYDWTRTLGFEFEVARVFDVAGDTENLDWGLTNFSGNVIYHFDRVPRFTPYATFGLGWERSDLDFDDDAGDEDVDSSTEVTFNFGGGVKYPLNNRIVARADLRRFQVNDEAPDHWRLYGGLTFWIKR
jgi:opacity protein-like surface antigen